jgi:hypothetical protein
MAISHWILVKIWNISDIVCRQNQNTHFTFNNFFPKIVPFNEIMSNKYGGYVTIRRICGAWWISKATRMHMPMRLGTHTHVRSHAEKYTILIAFPLQQWSRERASMLRLRTLPVLSFLPDESTRILRGKVDTSVDVPFSMLKWLLWHFGQYARCRMHVRFNAFWFHKWYVIM